MQGGWSAVGAGASTVRRTGSAAGPDLDGRTITSTSSASLDGVLSGRTHLPGTAGYDAARGGFDLSAIPSPDVAVMADVDVDTSLSRDTIRTFAHPDGVGAVFPLAEARARVVFFVDAPQDREPTLEQVQALADARMGARVVVSNPRWLTYFEIHHGQVPEYRHGRVLLAGDAAPIHSPAGGQGMNTGIQAAADLGWTLALVSRGRAGAELLDTYHAERHPIGAAVVRTTTAMTNVMTGAGPMAGLRDIALFLVGHVRELGHTAATEMAERTIDHRHSPLWVRHGQGHPVTVHAGSHAPDPDGLIHPDGAAVAVEELLTRPGLLLLARTDDRSAVDELHRVLGDLGTAVQVVTSARMAADDVPTDPQDAIGHHYGLGDDGLALVRPGGYIGLLATRTHPDVLRSYLQTPCTSRAPPVSDADTAAPRSDLRRAGRPHIDRSRRRAADRGAPFRPRALAAAHEATRKAPSMRGDRTPAEEGPVLPMSLTRVRRWKSWCVTSRPAAMSGVRSGS